MTYEVYDDVVTMRIIKEVCNMLNLSEEDVLNQFGEYFFCFCKQSGYDRMLRTLGGNLTEFIENLDALHSYLALSYEEMNAPSFRVERQVDGKMLLHYYSDRHGFCHIVPGIIGSVAKDFFNSEVTMKIIYQSEEKERTGKRVHVIFEVLQKLDVKMKISKHKFDEWKTPDKRLTIPKKFAKLYPFLEVALAQWAQPPKVDAPVSRLSKSTALPVMDTSALKHLTDRKLEAFLKAIFTTLGASLQPTFAAAWVNRAISVWNEQLSNAVCQGDPTADLLRLLANISEAQHYVTEAIFEVIRLEAKVSAMSVAARQVQWLKIWSADTISKKSLISLPFLGTSLQRRIRKRCLFNGAILTLLDKEVLELVPDMDIGSCFYSNLFVDLQDSYLHIAIHPDSRQYLSLTMTPQVFTRILGALVSIMHRDGIIVTPYMDDLLLKAPSLELFHQQVHDCIYTLTHHGWIRNMDTRKVSAVLACDPISAKKLTSLVGKLISAIEAVPFVMAHTRELQSFLIQVCKGNTDLLRMLVSLPLHVVLSLSWWLDLSNLTKGRHFLITFWTTVTTDVSLSGWGVILGHLNAQGSLLNLFQPVYPDKLWMDGKAFCHEFPFHMVFDKNLKVKQAGVNIQKYVPGLQTMDTRLDEYFTIDYPQVTFTISNIQTFINSQFVLKTRREMMPESWRNRPMIKLRGYMIWMESIQCMIYMCSPKLRNLQELEERKMHISDIAKHDVTRDLILLNHQRLAEIELSNQLERKKEELRILSKNLETEKKKTETLLYAMLPKHVANQLKEGKKVQAGEFKTCTILFSDVVTFTNICSACEPIHIVEMLNAMYSRFDRLTSVHDVYKVETIGDAYMVVGGVPVPVESHVERVANFALGMRIAAKEVMNPITGDPIQIRVGIHTGPVLAGVVGDKMPRYCLFGDTVNTASRMESHGLPDKIHISPTTFNVLKHLNFEIMERGVIEVKGKGKLDTYFLIKNLRISDNEIMGRLKPGTSKPDHKWDVASRGSSRTEPPLLLQPRSVPSSVPSSREPSSLES
ncbi:guanylate cyclase soluble subunit beta-2-like [Rhinophrynus dorsalis]